MNINKKLMEVRNKIKMGKDFYNPAGNFMFRNAEVMLSVIKPLCAEIGLTFYFSDEVIFVGNNNYIKSDIIVIDTEDGEEFRTSAVAREDNQAFAAPMISGSASSYAHKYVLQNAFAIDDGKMDPDSFGVEDNTAKEERQDNTENTGRDTNTAPDPQYNNPVQTQEQACVPVSNESAPHFVPEPKSNTGWTPEYPNYINEWDNLPKNPPQGFGQEQNAPSMPPCPEMPTLPPDPQFPESNNFGAPEIPEINQEPNTPVIIYNIVFNHKNNCLDIETNRGVISRNPYRREWVNLPAGTDPYEFYNMASDFVRMDLDSYNGSFQNYIR